MILKKRQKVYGDKHARHGFVTVAVRHEVHDMLVKLKAKTGYSYAELLCVAVQEFERHLTIEP